VSPLTAALPPQAIIRDKDTWVTGQFGGLRQNVGAPQSAGD
jgi:hypothetical protein